MVWLPEKKKTKTTLQKFFPFAVFGLAWLEVLSVTLRFWLKLPQKEEKVMKLPVPTQHGASHNPSISGPGSSRPWQLADF